MSRTKRPLFGVDPKEESEIDRAFAIACRTDIPTRDILREEKIEMPNVFAEIDAKNQISKMAREENAKVSSDKHQVLVSTETKPSATTLGLVTLEAKTNTSFLQKPTKVSILKRNV